MNTSQRRRCSQKIVRLCTIFRNLSQVIVKTTLTLLKNDKKSLPNWSHIQVITGIVPAIHVSSTVFAPTAAIDGITIPNSKIHIDIRNNYLMTNAVGPKAENINEIHESDKTLHTRYIIGYGPAAALKDRGSYFGILLRIRKRVTAIINENIVGEKTE